MCRHLGYLGPAMTLDRLLLDPPHSLARQAWAPQDMRGGGTINADGYGVGWFPDAGGGDGDGGDALGSAGPVRHRRTCPIWADDGLRALARHTRSGAVVAAVRSATVGMPVVETAAAPFTDGYRLFSHNGVLPGWPDSVSHLAERLPVRDLLTLDAPTDSALLWALVRDRLDDGADPVDAVADVVADVAAVEPAARLNLLLSDGRQIVATAWYHALSVLAGDDFVAVASEPWDDDPRWAPVPDHHLVRASAHGSGDGRARVRVDVSPLDAPLDAPATDHTMPSHPEGL